MVTIEGRGLLVLGIDDESEDRNLGANGAHDGIPEQSGAQFAPAIILIDGQPTHTRHRNRWVAGKTFHEGFGQVSQRDTSRSERIVSADPARGEFNGHVTSRNPPADILGDLFSKIPIQCFDAT